MLLYTPHCWLVIDDEMRCVVLSMPWVHLGWICQSDWSVRVLLIRFKPPKGRSWCPFCSCCSALFQGYLVQDCKHLFTYLTHWSTGSQGMEWIRAMILCAADHGWLYVRKMICIFPYLWCTLLQSEDLSPWLLLFLIHLIQQSTEIAGK
jgi:hypothetical protein